MAEADLGTMMAMQTPQGFAAAPLLAAYEQAAADGFAGTDTAACVTRYSGIRVRCIPGDDRNMQNHLSARRRRGREAGGRRCLIRRQAP